MLLKKMQSRGSAFLLLILVGLLFTVALPLLAQSSTTSPAGQLQDSWRRAQAIGRFHFETATQQTSHPTSRPENIGRRATSERFDVQGDVDQKAHALELQMWPNGRQLGQSLLLKVENGKTYGRASTNDEWLEVEDTADLFAQNGDPLGFLSAAENVRPLSGQSGGSLFPDELLPEELDGAITRYRFDLNGPAYAQYIRSVMEDDLRRRGELPSGFSLSMAQQFVDMTGEGELWLDARGLPYRQIIHVQFPAGENDLEWIEARITTGYSSWQPHILDLAALDWRDPAASLASVLLVAGLHPQDVLRFLTILGYILLILGACALLFGRHARRVRMAFSLSIAASLLFGPLLQVRQATAFHDRQEARSAAVQPSAETEDRTEEFQPNTNPLLSRPLDTPYKQAPAVTAATTELAPVQPERLSQTAACTVGEDTDCDGDGLADKVEIFELGTFADNVDTDGDGISDNLEVIGFSLGGELWYMNPRDPDSNKDGLPDGIECSTRNNINEDGSIDSSVPAGTCADTDKDGVPDVWDFDNDKDGVPDAVDGDPHTYYTVVNEQFGLTLAGYEKEKPLFINISVRPTDDQHLWWTNNYLDWPDLDQDGQIMRVTTETLGTDGDMMLSPILEITIPYDSANPSRGLPVKYGVDASGIRAATPIDDWLDQDTLDLYNITVTQDADSGILVVYTPLVLTKDIVGQTPVAWSALLYYEMAGASTGWGHDHEMRVLWTVNGIVDKCVPPDGETWSSYCDVGSERENTTNLSHWTSSNGILL